MLNNLYHSSQYIFHTGHKVYYYDGTLCRDFEPILNWRYTKHGGLHFIRIGRFHFSFALCRSF